MDLLNKLPLDNTDDALIAIDDNDVTLFEGNLLPMDGSTDPKAFFFFKSAGLIQFELELNGVGKLLVIF